MRCNEVKLRELPKAIFFGASGFEKFGIALFPADKLVLLAAINPFAL
jgi:hypothetical protein